MPYGSAIFILGQYSYLDRVIFTYYGNQTENSGISFSNYIDLDGINWFTSINETV